MYRATPERTLHTQVLSMVRQIRRRWRARIAIRGLAIVLGAGLLVFLLSVYGLEVSRFSTSSVIGFRVVLWLVGAALTARFLIWPLTRRVSDEQAALYLEENEPSLEASVLAALEAGSGSKQSSEALERRLVENALQRAGDINFGRRIEQKGLYRASGALAAVALGSLVLLLFGPTQLRSGAAALLFPTRDAGTVNPYSISVSPGDVTIARGSDQLVTAELQGFETTDVQIFFRGESADAFDRLSMIADGSEGFELLLLSLDENTDYFVESSGIRSATHRIEVADLPYVEHLELEYRFPAYTGLASRTVEFGGDIAAVRGTVVRLRVFPTMLTPGGQLLVDGEAVELTDEEDGTWTASLTVEREGYYEIALVRASGELVPASPQYVIDVLTDQPPSVSFSKPGRDERASPIEELYLEVKADDDYGVSELLLIYSVNGGPEDTISLFDGRPTPEVTAGHTLFLEEFGLETGDLISYYAQVEDANQGPDSRTAKSDIYFVQIRPFRVNFRQAEQGGGGGGGGGGEEERALSELQEQVVAATYNLARDRELYGESEFRENLVSVRLAQGRAREQVAGLLQRLTARGLGNDSEFEQIAKLLGAAIAEMAAAEEILESGNLSDAISPELRALLNLQKAEQNYEFEVSQGQQGGGGGGGARADDLADLFELELDKLKNQYETVQRGERRRAGDELDETLEALKELARRQQQQAERQRRAAAQQGGASGGASDRAQRELADETEAAARRLERLARETNDQMLMDASRRIQEAAADMRRAAAASGSSATADANSALDRLEEAQRRLERDRVDRLRSDVDDAQQRAEDLVREQRDIAADMERLADDGGGPGTEAGRRLFERKEAMTAEVADLEREIDRLSSDARAGQRNASDRLREAASTIRDDKLKERIRFSRGRIGDVRDREFTREFEAETTRIVEEIQQELEQASAAIGNSQADRRADALDRARDLSRGVESLSRRLGERGQQGQQSQDQQGQGQQGQQGQSGQQGQQGGQGGADGQVGQDQGGFGNLGGAYAGRRLSTGDIRQFRSEARQRIQEAIELQRILEEEDLNQQQLGQVIAALRQLDREDVYLDLAELNRLQSQIVEGLKQLEFGLRRELEGEDQDRVFVSGSDEVPTGFRRLVEEYYRALSRTPSTDR
ncbi:MAG: hypothetical protein IIC36_06960 [Gemmatimonadetes bacterium]|nr:hypothetical protein [Gemmatimonadota bacterium]